MLIIRRRFFWVGLGISLVAVLLPVVYVWFSLMESSSEAALLSPSQLKFIAEQALFFAGLAVLALSGLSLVLYSHARSQTRAAQNLMLSQRWMEAGEVILEERLGELGSSFYRINRELIETNRRRGMKVQGMNSLISFLMKNFEAALFVVNAGGEIGYVSTEYLEKNNLTRSELVRKPISALLPDIYYPEIIAEFERSPVMLQRKSSGSNYELYNIVDRRGEIAYVVFSRAGKVFSLTSGNNDPDDHNIPKARTFMNRLFSSYKK